jgi:hypothetical protein
MSFSEFAGLIILLIIFLFYMLRRGKEEKQRQQNPEQYAKEQKLKEKRYREFLRSMEVEIPDEEKESDHEIKEKKKSKKSLRPPKYQEKVKESSESSEWQKSSIAHSNRISSAPQTSSKHHKHTVIEIGKSYHEIRNQKPSRGARIIDQLKSRQDMVILYEIFGPARGSGKIDNVP